MQREILYDDVYDAQGHYRLLLDSMARPGKINVLPEMELTAPKGIHAAGALVGFALMNADVTYYVEGPTAFEVGRYLLVNTSARPVGREEADYVFLDGSAPAELLQELKVGSLPYPEDGATVVAAVDGLASEGEGLVLLLKGPGVAGEKKLCVIGLDRTFFEALATINGEFPLGIDVILTDGERRVACIPRSTKIGIN
ncbi:MAG TPA: phosphonate C-P lyase system protein PhnH [Puia sp.]|jgi:alpha-D-ribose 1-methylphosphonate 5-triphosphate synthase subunit PhnH|nr:phosphonate C-P lyase system protein PhnH [Puia sp.]